MPGFFCFEFGMHTEVLKGGISEYLTHHLIKGGGSLWNCKGGQYQNLGFSEQKCVKTFRLNIFAVCQCVCMCHYIYIYVCMCNVPKKRASTNFWTQKEMNHLPTIGRVRTFHRAWEKVSEVAEVTTNSRQELWPQPPV